MGWGCRGSWGSGLPTWSTGRAGEGARIPPPPGSPAAVHPPLPPRRAPSPRGRSSCPAGGGGGGYVSPLRMGRRAGLGRVRNFPESRGCGLRAAPHPAEHPTTTTTSGRAPLPPGPPNCPRGERGGRPGPRSVTLAAGQLPPPPPAPGRGAPPPSSQGRRAGAGAGPCPAGQPGRRDRTGRQGRTGPG